MRLLTTYIPSRSDAERAELSLAGRGWEGYEPRYPPDDLCQLAYGRRVLGAAAAAEAAVLGEEDIAGA